MQKILLSANPNIIDKNFDGPNQKWLRRGWIPAELTFEEFAQYINSGGAFSVQYIGETRHSQYYNCAGYLAVDSDKGWTIAEALADPFVQKYGSIFYKTPSHGEEGIDRFRIIFATQTPIESPKKFKLATKALAAKFKTDPKIADPARILCGCQNSRPTILGGVLPDKEIRALVKAGRRLKKDQAAVQGGGLGMGGLFQGAQVAGHGVPPSLTIQLAKGGSAAFQDIAKGVGVYCPFHADKRPSAFTLRSRQGVPGIHCQACDKTWFLEGSKPPPKYDFYKFEAIAERVASWERNVNAKLKKEGKGPTRITAQLINEKFLPPISPQSGITLVKSHKGSGKTTALADLVKEAKRRKLSVLLLGHRQTLLRELASKLGLICYLDHPPQIMKNGKPSSNPAPDHFACSIDSLVRMLPTGRPYDVVIIDESEQVFSHVTARTIRSAHQVMLRLNHYVGKTKSIYLFDADLNQVTFYFVGSARLHDPRQPLRIILNRYTCEGRVCELFESPNHLVADMLRSAKAGKRIFVACNSKNRAQAYSRLLSKEAGKPYKVLLITAEEKIRDEVQDFLADVPNNILDYDAVVASPAIGTGIDISFPGGTAEIDVVYGFFTAGINSHYDVDQQLGRVRNPKEVKVWVSGRGNNFETDIEAIKHDIVRADDAHQAVYDFSDGLPVADWKHPLLNLQALAYCAQRASQNDLKNLFIAHKERNGWKIVKVEKNIAIAKAVGKKVDQVKDEFEAERRAGILNAEAIDQYQWKEYFDHIAKGETILGSAVHEMAAFELRNFYNQPIDDKLIALDANGSYRSSVLLFEKLGFWGPAKVSHFLKRWNSGDFKLDERIGEIPVRCIGAAVVSAGLIDEGGFNAERVITRADLATFLNFCKIHNTTIQRDLGVVLREDRNHNPVRALNQILQLIGIEVEPLGKTKKNGAAIYRYGLNKARLDFLLKIIKSRREPRCDLPEVLDPPRPRRRSSAVAGPAPNTIYSLFEPPAPIPGG